MALALRMGPDAATLYDYTARVGYLHWSRGRTRLPLYLYMQPGRLEFSLPHIVLVEAGRALADGWVVELDFDGRAVFRGWIQGWRHRPEIAEVRVTAGDALRVYGRRRWSGLVEIYKPHPGFSYLARPRYQAGDVRYTGYVGMREVIRQCYRAMGLPAAAVAGIDAERAYFGGLPVGEQSSDTNYDVVETGVETGRHWAFADFEPDGGMQRECIMMSGAMLYVRGNGVMRYIEGQFMAGRYAGLEQSVPRYSTRPDDRILEAVTVTFAGDWIGRFMPATLTLAAPLQWEVRRSETYRDVELRMQPYRLQSGIAEDALTWESSGIAQPGGIGVAMLHRGSGYWPGAWPLTLQWGQGVSLWTSGDGGAELSVDAIFNDFGGVPVEQPNGVRSGWQVRPAANIGNGILFEVAPADSSIAPGSSLAIGSLARRYLNFRRLNVDYLGGHWYGPDGSVHRRYLEGENEEGDTYQHETLLANLPAGFGNIGNGLRDLIARVRNEYRLTYAFEEMPADWLGDGAAAEVEVGGLLRVDGGEWWSPAVGMVCEGLELDLGQELPGQWRGRYQIYGREVLSP